MCELFAVSSDRPVVIQMTLREFQRHGGETANNSDGWGIAFYEDNDARIIRESEAAATSEHLDYLRGHACASRNIIAHIRQASVGNTRLQNTQPFTRVLSGRLHTFAHNGDLYDLPEEPLMSPFSPLGDTDSERAFSALMHRLWSASERRGTIPEYPERLEIVVDFTEALKGLGIFNFLYCDGEYLFAHSHKRTQADGEIKPPGMHLLQRDGAIHEHHDIAGIDVEFGHSHAKMSLVASVPLSSEPWEALDTDSLVALKDGQAISRVAL